MLCVKFCAGRAIRVTDEVAQLESHMWLLAKRDFKAHSSQIVCLLKDLFSINPSLCSTAPAVVQSPGYLPIP